MANTQVGFVGAGVMGEPMAASLLRAGYAVSVCAHRNREPVERLIAQGATDGGDPAGAARGSAFLITCVPDAPQVDEALFGERGAASGAAPGTMFIDMSTISPVATRAFDARLRASGFRFADAPVSGGAARAKTGTLTIMAGASDVDFPAIEPVLAAMGTPNHVGGVGMGEVVKLVNQIIISNTMIANIEALTFAAKAGADIDATLAVIGTATGSNYLLQNWLPQSWLAGSHKPGFMLDLLRKDLAAALDSARAMGVPMPASSLAYQMFTATSGEGHGRDDYSSVALFYERAAGVQVRKKK
ncbi:MAG: 3-hydroxyisobutyrate dehydrogenase [Candidatus Eremiobacteraeota bacterium]|jgi:3-hydroxyisobutyrate dehydrogenase-like beta-hydroxyacid dehydrogenase|nr:3-hydroxyisobutyrate dehydrogenase [Candidatus Eremiobacteraeota bacterium]